MGQKSGLNRVAAVYKGVSEKEVKELFMRLGGVNKLPTPVENEKYTKLNGKKHYAIQLLHLMEIR